MMWRVSVSSNTSSVASGGSPIHSTECVSHGFGGFSTYCINLRSSALICGCNCHRLDRAEGEKHLLPGRTGSLDEADVVVRDLGYAPRVDPAGHGLYIDDLAFKAAKKVLKVLSCHSSLRFFPRPGHKKVAVLIRILQRHETPAPTFIDRRRNVRTV